MDKPTLALLLIGAVHVLVLPLLVWVLLDGERFDLRAWWPGGEDDGGADEPPAEPPDPCGGNVRSRPPMPSRPRATGRSSRRPVRQRSGR